MTEVVDQDSYKKLAAELENYSKSLTKRTKELNHSRRMLMALQTTNEVIASNPTLEIILKTVAEETTRILDVSGCAISLWNKEDDSVQTVSCYGPEEWFDSPEETTYQLEDYPLTKRVLVGKEVVRISTGHPDIDPAETALLQDLGIKKNIMLPMNYQDDVIGLAEIYIVQPDRSLNDEEISLAQSLFNQAAIALENTRLSAETEKQLREQTALRETAEILSSTLDLDEVLTKIAEQMALLTETTSAYICIYEPDSNQITVKAEYIGPNACIEEQVSDLGVIYQKDDRDFMALLESGQAVINNLDDPDLPSNDLMHMLEYGAKTVMYIPLRYQGRLNGYVELWESRRVREFSTREINLVQSIAQQAANAIENANLYQKAQQEIKKRERLQAQLERYTHELERSNQDLQQFAYITSHDLQEPLRMITSYLQLLERRYKGALDSDAEDFIYYAVDGARRMQELINGLLLFSRVKTQASELQITDSQEVMEQAKHNLQLVIDESSAQIYYEELPQIMADRTQLMQLFQNLISNAIKYNDSDPPVIHIHTKHQNEEWLFSFSDNGIGFDQDQSERIFKIFQRLHSRDEYPGTGIGLAVCKRIVERHHGRIWVETQKGRGSTFYFTIPAGNGDMSIKDHQGIDQ